MSNEIELSFETLLRFFRVYWLRLGLFLVTGFALGVVLAAFSDPKYEARAVLAEKTNRLDPSASSLPEIGALGGITRYLTGAPEQPEDLKRFTHLIRSNEIAAAIHSNDILVARIFPKRWDSESQEWKFHKPSLPGRLVRFLLQSPRSNTAKPSVWEVREYLNNEVMLINLEAKGFWIVQYRHSEREIALELISEMIRSADDILRTRAALELDSQALYLEEKIDSTLESEHRMTLYSLLGSVDQKRMLLSSDQTYAFDFVEPPFVPDVAKRRYTFLMILAGTVLGAVIGFLSIALIRTMGPLERRWKPAA